MAYVAVGGIHGFPYPRLPFLTSLGAFTSSTIDATGEKFAWVGRVATPNFGSKNLHKAIFNWGAVTKAGGSGLTFSLQNVSTSGPPGQPDGTQDETVAIAAADVTANSMHVTNAFSADRTVTHGDLISAVLEFDGSGRLGADSFAVRNAACNLIDGGPMFPVCSLLTASWARQGARPSILFENSDGTISTVYGGYWLSGTNQHSVGSVSTPDEYSNVITLPWACKANGCWFYGGPNNSSANYSAILYNGTTAVTNTTVAVDANQVGAANSVSWNFLPFAAEVELAAQVYRLAIRPDTTNAMTMQSHDVGNAAYMAVHDGGTGVYSSTRTDAGSWTDLTTRRLLCGLNITAIDIGSGGGFKRHSGMQGGFR